MVAEFILGGARQTLSTGAMSYHKATMATSGKISLVEKSRPG